MTADRSTVPATPARRPARPDRKAAGGAKRPGLEPRLTVEDVARRYSISAWTVREWLKAEKLRGVLMDGRWSVTWDAVFAFEGRLAPPTGAARERAKAPLLTVDDLADYFRRKPDTMRRWLAADKLAARKIEGCWYSDREAVLAYELARLTRSGDGDDAS